MVKNKGNLAKRGRNRTARIYHRSPPNDWEGKCCSISLKSFRAWSGVGSVNDISCSGGRKSNLAVELSLLGRRIGDWGVRRSERACE